MISGISTRETYFERYQGVWDIMVTVKDTEIDSFGETEEKMSEEMKSFGGFSHASGKYVTETPEGWLINTPVVILDDASFLAYCEQIGITPQLGGAVIRNLIRDVTNPDFRHPRYMPYVKGDNAASILRQSGKDRWAEWRKILMSVFLAEKM